MIALVRVRHRDAKKLCAKYHASGDPFLRSEAERAEALRARLAERKER